MSRKMKKLTCLLTAVSTSFIFIVPVAYASEPTVIDIPTIFDVSEGQEAGNMAGAVFALPAGEGNDLEASDHGHGTVTDENIVNGSGTTGPSTVTANFPPSFYPIGGERSTQPAAVGDEISAQFPTLFVWSCSNAYHYMTPVLNVNPDYVGNSVIDFSEPVIDSVASLVNIEGVVTSIGDGGSAAGSTAAGNQAAGAGSGSTAGAGSGSNTAGAGSGSNVAGTGSGSGAAGSAAGSGGAGNQASGAQQSAQHTGPTYQGSSQSSFEIPQQKILGAGADGKMFTQDDIVDAGADGVVGTADDVTFIDTANYQASSQESMTPGSASAQGSAFNQKDQALGGGAVEGSQNDMLGAGTAGSASDMLGAGASGSASDMLGAGAAGSASQTLSVGASGSATQMAQQLAEAVQQAAANNTIMTNQDILNIVGNSGDYVFTFGFRQDFEVNNGEKVDSEKVANGISASLYNSMIALGEGAAAAPGAGAAGGGGITVAAGASAAGSAVGGEIAVSGLGAGNEAGALDLGGAVGIQDVSMELGEWNDKKVDELGLLKFGQIDMSWLHELTEADGLLVGTFEDGTAIGQDLGGDVGAGGQGNGANGGNGGNGANGGNANNDGSIASSTPRGTVNFVQRPQGDGYRRMHGGGKIVDPGGELKTDTAAGFEAFDAARNQAVQESNADINPDAQIDPYAGTNQWEKPRYKIDY